MSSLLVSIRPDQYDRLRWMTSISKVPVGAMDEYPNTKRVCRIWGSKPYSVDAANRRRTSSYRTLDQRWTRVFLVHTNAHLQQPSAIQIQHRRHPSLYYPLAIDRSTLRFAPRSLPSLPSCCFPAPRRSQTDTTPSLRRTRRP